jgi:hypothetical protein
MKAVTCQGTGSRKGKPAGRGAVAIMIMVDMTIVVAMVDMMMVMVDIMNRQ